jgi:undecaprenyl-diphosphatase
MNVFDESIVLFVNQFVRHSKIFDLIVVEVANNELLKGGVLAFVIWCLWFKPDTNQKEIRITLISTFIGSLAAVFIGRILPLTLPFRSRPIFEHDIHLVMPYYFYNFGLDKLSSFPSDHATLFFSISTGIYFASKKIGRWMILYTLIFIASPRIYLGFHYPTDILMGAFIGVAIVTLANMQWVKAKASSKIYTLSEQHPQIFYPLMFILTFQISVLFIDLRQIAKLASNIVKLLINHPF